MVSREIKKLLAQQLSSQALDAPINKVIRGRPSRCEVVCLRDAYLGLTFKFTLLNRIGNETQSCCPIKYWYFDGTVHPKAADSNIAHFVDDFLNKRRTLKNQHFSPTTCYPTTMR